MMIVMILAKMITIMMMNLKPDPFLNVQIAPLVFVGIAFVPRGLAEWPPRADCISLNAGD